MNGAAAGVGARQCPGSGGLRRLLQGPLQARNRAASTTAGWPRAQVASSIQSPVSFLQLPRVAGASWAAPGQPAVLAPLPALVFSPSSSARGLSGALPVRPPGPSLVPALGMRTPLEARFSASPCPLWSPCVWLGFCNSGSLVFSPFPEEGPLGAGLHPKPNLPSALPSPRPIPGPLLLGPSLLQSLPGQGGQRLHIQEPTSPGFLGRGQDSVLLTAPSILDVLPPRLCASFS